MRKQKERKNLIYIAGLTIGLIVLVILSICLEQSPEKHKKVRKEKKAVASVLNTSSNAKDNKKAGDYSASEIKNISMQVGKTEKERNFNWFSKENAGKSYIEIEEKSLMKNQKFTSKSKHFFSESKRAFDKGYCFNRAEVCGLKENTTYCYRVVCKDTCSDTYSFETKKFLENSSDVLIIADAQIMEEEKEKDTKDFISTLDTALTKFLDAETLISEGDQINSLEYQVDEYENFLKCLTRFNLPLAPLVGNHDDKGFTFNEYFNVPNLSNLGASKNNGGDYYFELNNVLFLVLNSNCYDEKQHQKFLDDAISKHEDDKWKIVLFHHSLYSVGDHVYNKKIIRMKKKLAPVIAKYDIDIVINGHDHVYARSHELVGDEINKVCNEDGSPASSVTNPKGIFYFTLNSSSGSKYYDVCDEDFDYTAVKNQNYKRSFTHLTTDDDALEITTYQADNQKIIDTFTIYK